MILRREGVEAVESSDVLLEVRRCEESVERLGRDDDAREGRKSRLTKRSEPARLATDRRTDRLHAHRRQIHTPLVHPYGSSSSALGPMSEAVGKRTPGLTVRHCGG